MKYLLIVVLSLSVYAADKKKMNKEENFAKAKKATIESLTERRDIISTTLKCAEGAKNREDLRNCRKAQREKMQATVKGFKEMRMKRKQERKAHREANREAKKEAKKKN